MPRSLTRACVPLLLAAGASLLPGRAHAFEYDEHCWISNQAFRIAVAHVRAQAQPADSAFLARLDQALGQLGGRPVCGAPSARSYGDLVALVDMARSPVEFYLGYPNPAGMRQARGDSLPWNVLDRTSGNFFRSLRALHENQDHFAPRSLLAVQEWHALAMRTAADGKLAGALLVNAFADHYLQDHFAPGHIYTPRQGLNDGLSMGIHDHYNRRGARYRVRGTNTLLALLPAGGVIEDDSLRKVATRACPEASVRECLARMEGEGIVLRGDGQLGLMPEQALYVVLVMARSVADVLEAARTPGAVNHFADLRWTGYRPGPRGTPGERGYAWTAPSASTPFGSYEPAPSRKRFPRFDRFPVLHYGLQSFPAGGGGTRSVVRLETLVLAWPGDWLDSLAVERPMVAAMGRAQPSLLLGADAVFDTREAGFGPVLSYQVPITDINAQITYSAGARWYPGVEGNQVGPHGGVTLGMGFGLVYFGTHLGLDSYAADGRLHRPAFTVAPFISGIVPLRRHGWPKGSPGHEPRR